MKKLIITLGLWLLVTGLWAQNDTGAKVVTVSQALQKTVGATNYTIQVGLPYLVSVEQSSVIFNPANPNYPFDIRFPWDVLYLYPTFTNQEGSFEVSKGYFGDKILISWNIRSNSDLITTLKLYRREYSDNPLPWSNENDFIKNISKTDAEYEDKYVEGGVLYEYKLFAEGVNNTEELYANYITGIGFRNPTAVVTGNVSYDGRGPVKDVIIRAKSEGGAINIGNALNVPAIGQLEIKQINNTITTAATLQTWLKLETAYTDDGGASVRLFKLESSSEIDKSIDVKVKLLASSNILEVNIGGSIYKLHNYYPSGEVNYKGDETLLKVSDFNSKFVHFSVVIRDGEVPTLFINGRVISNEFRNITHENLVDIDPKYTAPYFEVELPTQTNSLTLLYPNSKWDNVYLGGENAAILDEIRVWKSAVDTLKIRTDFKRYISGNNVNLISYLSANEGVGEFAYDFSRNGFNYNKNNAKLVATNWITGLENVPSSDQLGILGITNESGNYQISSIPYSGTGETYTITPLYGQHKFEPGNQLVFLGQGSEVINKVDFIDKSSFIFKGKVLYDSREVFTSFDKDPLLVGNIIDEGYNAYELNSTPYDKGEYWSAIDDAGDSYLARYSPIYVEDVQVFIDGEIARDGDGIPIMTKFDPASGTAGFEINVPIGRHYITVKKEGHVFKYNGRFPQASNIDEYNLNEFVQNSESEVVFIDETKVEVVGRVVGGAVQAQKVIGFGDQGAFSKDIEDENGDLNTITISSKNNIGIANITLGYGPPGFAPLANNKFSFKTDSITGEYRVNLLPLKYELLADDIYLKNRNDIKLYADDSFVPPTDFREVTNLVTPKYNLTANDTIYGEPYNHSLIFEYRVDPTINVLKQTSDKEISVRNSNGEIELVSTDGFGVLLYTQFEAYTILLEAFEKYTNKDNSADEIDDFVPVIDGIFEIDNGLEFEESGALIDFDGTGSKILYIWEAGEPFVNDDFRKTLLIKYNRNGSLFYPNAITYSSEGIILGGANDGSVGVLTAAPDMPDFILRDPPGSNSFASIEAGSSISINEQLVYNNGIKFSSSEKLKTGMIFQVGGGLAGPIITTANYNDFETGSSYELTSTNANSVTKTYTFNQTISTSSDPEFVGSDGDLYIGKSKNYYYGTYFKIEALGETRTNSVPLTNDVGETIYIGKTLGQTFTEDPMQTTFMYSQKYILNTLIPKLQSYIDQYDSGDLQPDNTEFLAREQYEEQIIQWQSFIQENERAKYEALYNREEYLLDMKQNLEAQIAEYGVLPAAAIPVLDAIGSAGEYVEQVPSWIWTLVSKAMNKGKKGTGGGVKAVRDIILTLHERRDALQKTLNFLDENSVNNFSLDAGVGEYFNSSEISFVRSKRRDIKLKTSNEFLKKTGATSSGLGFIKNISLRSAGESALSVGEENSKTSVVNYTLKDNDENNFISVDVVNSFDGNGPIFSTKGGRTSCPYEGADESIFYIDAKFSIDYEEEKAKLLAIPKTEFLFTHDIIIDPNHPEFSDFIYAAKINSMAISHALGKIYTGNDKLGFATERIEKPEISVLERSKENVPESIAAEFDLTLTNNSVVEADADFLLIVDLDKLNGAKINIEQNGTIVRIPFGKSVKFKMTLEKVALDVFDYEDINISLRSLCEGEDNSDEVTVEAHFIPVCSEVVVNAPLSNWSYNLSKAYNVDGTTKPLSISLAGYSTAFSSFEKIVLDYRSAGSWKPLQIYYVNEADFDADILNGVTNVSFIGNKSSLSYSWDIADQNLADGDYEIRARSFCSDGTSFTSEIINGSVDLNAPKRFGTPLPIDGVLGAGEDLRVSFNENIFFNSLASQIQILGQTNQASIDHNVSLYFEGLNNTAIINNPKITSGDLTFEFWMNNSTIVGNADIIRQDGGLNIRLTNGELFFTLGGITAQGSIADDGLFHHYTFTHKNSTGEISIYQDDTEIAGVTGNGNLLFTNNNALVIGGNTFIGNLHDLRLWNKTISLENAYAKMFDKLIGNEANLIGYWPMDEGRGEIAKDISRYKHAVVNASWDIKPKGTSWEFKDGNFLELDASVNLTNEMDATISFWMKTEISQEATLFSNGRGDGSDSVKPNGKMNKWAINIASDGKLSLDSEGKTYELTSQNMADDKWHHVTVLFNRIGSLRTYVDAQQVSSNQMAEIGAFKDSNKIWLGARGFQDAGGNFTMDRKFTGNLDEFRLWNTLRNVEQISRDRFNEMDFESIGLSLYARMNAPETFTGNGPRFYYANSNPTKQKETSTANSVGLVNYSDDVPAIKPARNLTKFKVNFVINEDEMILEPDVSDWSVIEGQILDVTVGLMFDSFGNMQESPITWTAYVKRNEVSWFTEGYNEIVDIVKNTEEEKSFEITLINKGGKGQPFSINNIPSWLKLSSTSGTLQPDSKIIITASIDKELTPGEYLENLYLQTDFGYDEKLQIKIRVLAEEPDWEVDPNDFDYSMNIVGRVKIDGKFSEDSYDKIAAFINGEVRGAADLIYNEAFQEYYAYVSVYSNIIYGENIVFSIWDASQGKILEASIDGNPNTLFKENEVIGTLSNAIIFENTDVIEQEIQLNDGWTWVSLNVNDTDFSDINALTQNLVLETNDRMLSHSPSFLETYYKNESTPSNSGWSGSISANGGISIDKMYKVYMSYEQSLKIKGFAVDISAWSFSMQKNWNWLPYPLARNQSVNEALAYFDAVDGDVIKSQNLFAIYDPIVGWNGTLNYLESGEGYMIKSSKEQSFGYPSYLNKSVSGKSSNKFGNNKQAKTATKYRKYAANMNAVVLLPEGYDELFVYDTQGKLKGEAYTQVVDDKELSFITIYGEPDDTLEFYIGNGKDIKPTAKTFSFKGNNILGTFKKPIVLEKYSDVISVFPNPFENQLTIKVNALESQIAFIQLYSMSGQLLLSEIQNVEKGVNWVRISPRVASGTYLLQVKLKEHTALSKVIKK